MRRLLPSSLFGQVMLSVAMALMVAQFISVVLLVRASEDRREAAAVTTLAFRLINGAERAERIDEGFERPDNRPRIRERLREQRRALREAGGPEAEQFVRDRLPIILRYNVTPERPLAALQTDVREDLTARLGEAVHHDDVGVRLFIQQRIDKGHAHGPAADHEIICRKLFRHGRDSNAPLHKGNRD